MASLRPLISGLLLTLAAAASLSAAAPKIEVENAAHEFGTVCVGEKITHEFVLLNAGNAPLVIQKVNTDCGCTSVADAEQKIGVGATGKIRIELNTASLKGSVAKQVQVISNCLDQPRLLLTMRGTVIDPVSVEPTELYFPSLESGEHQAKVILTNNLPEPMAIESITGDSTQFTIEVKTLERGKKFELVATAVPPFLPGNERGRILVKCADSQHGTITLDVLARYRPFTLEPAKGAAFVLVSPDDEQKQTVRISNRQEQPLVIESARSITKRYRVEVIEIEPGKEYDLEVTTAGPFPVGQTGGAIQLSTSDKKNSSLFVKATASLAAVTATPAALEFASLGADDHPHQTVTLWNHSKQPVRIASVASSGGFEGRMKDEFVIQPAGRGELEVTARGPFQQGSNAGELTVKTDSAVTSKLSIPVRGNWQPPPIWHPGRVRLAVGTKNDLRKTITRYIDVICHAEQELAIQELTVSNSAVKTTLHTIEPGKFYRVGLEFGQPIKPSDDDQLQFKTNVSGFEQVSIPIVYEQAQP